MTILAKKAIIAAVHGFRSMETPLVPQNFAVQTVSILLQLLGLAINVDKVTFLVLENAGTLPNSNRLAPQPVPTRGLFALPKIIQDVEQLAVPVLAMPILAWVAAFPVAQILQRFAMLVLQAIQMLEKLAAPPMRFVLASVVRTLPVLVQIQPEILAATPLTLSRQGLIQI